MIAARQIYLGRGGGAKLPYDSEVEYLESSGTQWIDTGFVATENTRVSAELMTISTGNRNWFGGNVVGNGGSANGFVFNSWTFDGIEWVFGGSGWNSTKVSNIVGRKFTLDFGKDGIIIDGQTIATPSYTSFTQQTNPIAVFVRVGGTAYINGRLYLFRIYDNNAIVRDMIPVRFTNEQGVSEGAMYDRVSGQLFRNSGTGAFLYGGDVYSVPVETSWYVQDGLVAMWDGKENAGVGKRCDTATSWVDLVGASEIPLNDAWSFGDNNLSIPNQTYGGSHVPMIIPTGETGQLDLCFSASGYTSSYGWILDGGLGLGNARGPCIDSPLGANADFPAGTSMELRYWTESTLEIKKTYAYSVSFDGSNGRRITDGVISQFSAYTGTFNGVAVFNAYNYHRPVTGIIFNIRIYSRSLTAAEIAANYAVDAARFNLPTAS